jgi:hypothetical protein
MPVDADTSALLDATVARLVAERLLPAEDVVENDDEVPAALVEEMRALGLFGLSIHEEYGGLGLSLEQEARLMLLMLRLASPCPYDLKASPRQATSRSGRYTGPRRRRAGARGRRSASSTTINPQSRGVIVCHRAMPPGPQRQHRPNAGQQGTAARCGQISHCHGLTGMRATTLISKSKPASQVTPTAVQAG